MRERIFNSSVRRQRPLRIIFSLNLGQRIPSIPYARMLSDVAKAVGKSGKTLVAAADDMRSASTALGAAGIKVTELEEHLNMVDSSFKNFKNEVESLGINKLNDAIAQVHLDTRDARKNLESLKDNHSQLVRDISDANSIVIALQKKVRKITGGVLVSVISALLGMYIALTHDRPVKPHDFLIQLIKDYLKKIMGVQEDEIDSHTQNILISVDTLTDRIDDEIQRLQYKYSQSFSGSWYLSMFSRGHSHSLKIKFLLDLKNELLLFGRKEITSKELYKLIEEKLLLTDFKYAYSSTEKEDNLFLQDFSLKNKA